MSGKNKGGGQDLIGVGKIIAMQDKEGEDDVFIVTRILSFNAEEAKVP
jgi:hypothetical protein